MSIVAHLKPVSDWNKFPTDLQEYIFEMLQDDPHSIDSAERTCRAWRKTCDSWRLFQFRNAIPQNSKLDLSLYPHITDGDTRVLFAALKKSEVHLSTWD